MSVAQGRTVNSELTVLLDSQLPFPALPAQRLGAERRPLGVRGVRQTQKAAASLVKKAALTAKASCGWWGVSSPSLGYASLGGTNNHKYYGNYTGILENMEYPGPSFSQLPSPHLPMIQKNGYSSRITVFLTFWILCCLSVSISICSSIEDSLWLGRPWWPSG